MSYTSQSTPEYFGRLFSETSAGQPPHSAARKQRNPDKRIYAGQRMQAHRMKENTEEMQNTVLKHNRQIFKK